MFDLHTDINHRNLKLPKQFFEGLCELFLELGIDGHEFSNDFNRYYVQHAAKTFKRKADVYNATGFSEYTAKKYLDNSQYNANPKRKQYYRSLINDLKEMCERSKDGTIPIHGTHKSYVAAFNDANATNNTITAPSMLKKLIKAGIVEKVDDKNIKFVTSLQTKGFNTQEDILRLLADLVSRASGTLLHNLLTKNSEETLFQMAYFSNVVHPDNKKKLSNELREEQRKDYRKYQKMIDSYEEKGFMRKWVQSLNEEIGVTSLIFKTQTRKNHENT